MTIVSTTAICLSTCLSAIFAFLFGRSAVISTRRLNRLNKTKDERDKLSRSLDKIENSSKYDRHFEIEEDDSNSTCRVFMKVYVRKSTYVGEHIESICYCLIKEFPYEDDKDFARSEAQELLDKINEK